MNEGKELNVLVLNPFLMGKIITRGETKEGVLNMLTLPMYEVYHVNEDPDGKHGINPLIGKPFESIIIDLRKLKQHTQSTQKIEEMLFIIAHEKSLKHKKIAFLGDEKLIKNNFEILKEDIIFDSLSDAIMINI